MISTFFGLIIAGLTAVWYRRPRFQKFLSLVIAGFLTIGFYDIFYSLKNGITENYSYNWLASRYYPVNLDFSTTFESYALLIPLFAAAILNAFFTIWDKLERHKLYVVALSTLNLAALIMLVCAQNSIQMLVSVCFIDVFGFCLIDNIAARRRYIFYNLLADMALFMAFAMLWGACQETLFSSLGMCRATEAQGAFVLVMLSACLKSGLFPFQGYLLPASILTESRRTTLNFLSTPIAGLLMIFKILPVLSEEFIGLPFLKYAAIISIIWGGIGGILIKRTADKKIYLNIIFYGLMCLLMLSQKKTFIENWGALLLLQISLDNIALKTKKYQAWLFMGMTLLEAGIIIKVLTLSPEGFIPLYLVAGLSVIGSLFYEVNNQEHEENNIGRLIIATGVAIYTLYGVENVLMQVYIWLGIGTLLILFGPYRFIEKLFHSEKLQETDVFSQVFYWIFAMPVFFVGRILWVTIDFLIIEKTFLSSLAKSYHILSRIFNWLHTASLKNALLFTLIGIAMMYYAVYRGK